MKAILATKPTLEKILFENIVPFWFPECIDEDNGGYFGEMDLEGKWSKASAKHTITTARTCWFFSRMARKGYLPEALPAARHGFEYLLNSLQDELQGGFFWGVTSDGRTVATAQKRLYCHAFALYAIAEYGRASGDPRASSLAADCAEVLEDRFHDPLHGGYHREFSRSWGALPPEAPDFEKKRLKTFNDHLHVLEGLTGYLELHWSEAVRSRIRELILILTNTVVRKRFGACTDWHGEDWMPLTGEEFAVVSYGHDLESSWLVQEASRPAGQPASLVLDWALALNEYAFQWGWDRKKGGVFLEGALGRKAHRREKVWWVQAEALVSSLTAFRATGDPRWADLYLSTLEWIKHQQVDWQGGDWHAVIRPDGKIVGKKAWLWKAPYHNGRSMMRCLELLTPGAV